MPDAVTPTTALDVMLGVDSTAVMLDIDGTPGECAGIGGNCPFADPAGKVNQDDPAEAEYDCSLLGQLVWGHFPKCSRVDWQRRAREELAAMPLGQLVTRRSGLSPT